jgi:hypothetical protein
MLSQHSRGLAHLLIHHQLHGSQPTNNLRKNKLLHPVTQAITTENIKLKTITTNITHHILKTRKRLKTISKKIGDSGGTIIPIIMQINLRKVATSIRLNRMLIIKARITIRDMDQLTRGPLIALDQEKVLLIQEVNMTNKTQIKEIALIKAHTRRLELKRMHTIRTSMISLIKHLGEAVDSIHPQVTKTQNTMMLTVTLTSLRRIDLKRGLNLKSIRNMNQIRIVCLIN